MLRHFDDLLDLLVEPFGGFYSICRVEIAVMERRELLELLLDVLALDLLDDIANVGLEVDLVRIRSSDGGKPSRRRVVVLPLGDIKEVNVILKRR